MGQGRNRADEKKEGKVRYTEQGGYRRGGGDRSPLEKWGKF